MTFAGHYASWLTLTVWRKKSAIFVISVVVIFLVIYFNLNITSPLFILKENMELVKIPGTQDKLSLLGGSSVHFIKTVNLVTESFPDFNMDDPLSAEDVKIRKNVVEDSFFSDFNTYSKLPFLPKERLFHLDLKGAPPKVSYMKKIFKLAKSLGATGVLLEWEDMFPWSGNLLNLAATNAYTKNDVREIIASAKENELNIIPLIQTFGHVEFALKLEFYSHLREVPESSQALCPSLNASVELIEHMIDQIMDMHTDAAYLHIGCDEVFQMGECSRCRNQPRENLFLSHVSRVANIIKQKHKNVKPIIWDDMLRHLSQTSLEQFHIGELVEPMVWVYAEDVYRFVPNSVWDKYAAVFSRVWSASAFKGAFGETLYIPNVKRHVENNLRWLEVMNNENSKFKNGFNGIVITGWQRYDHFSVLCELLPAAIPSLAVSLTLVTYGFLNSSIRIKLNNHLECGVFGPTSTFNLNLDPFLWDSYSRCAFPGHAFFKLTYKLNNAEKEVKELIHEIRKQKGWMTDYNVRHNFSTPLRIEELMQEESRIYNTIVSLGRAARESLSDVFDHYTIGEWVEQKIYPYLLELEKIQKDAFALKARRVWPRRPFPVLKELERFGVQVSEENRDGLLSPG